MEFKEFSPSENETWRTLYDRQTPLRGQQMVPEFDAGLVALGITNERIPDLGEVNQKLKALTGFQGLPVEGYIAPADFFKLLSERIFPVGNFIRDAQDLNYTPAPDVFHDLYGHLPFYADPHYAQFCLDFAEHALKSVNREEALKAWDRLFWFTIEFAVLTTPAGRRIFGAGIASSFSECAFALSAEPEVIPFDLEKISRHVFKIDEFQKTLYLLNSREQLYSCLPRFEKVIAKF